VLASDEQKNMHNVALCFYSLFGTVCVICYQPWTNKHCTIFCMWHAHMMHTVHTKLFTTPVWKLKLNPYIYNPITWF